MLQSMREQIAENVGLFHGSERIKAEKEGAAALKSGIFRNKHRMRQ